MSSVVLARGCLAGKPSSMLTTLFSSRLSISVVTAIKVSRENPQVLDMSLWIKYKINGLLVAIFMHIRTCWPLGCCNQTLCAMALAHLHLLIELWPLLLGKAMLICSSWPIVDCLNIISLTGIVLLFHEFCHFRAEQAFNVSNWLLFHPVMQSMLGQKKGLELPHRIFAPESFQDRPFLYGFQYAEYQFQYAIIHVNYIHVKYIIPWRHGLRPPVHEIEPG